MVGENDFENRRKIILDEHNFLYRFIRNIAPQKIEREDVEAKRGVIRCESEITTLLNSIMIDKNRISVTSSDSKGAFTFQNNLILAVKKGYFTITDNSTSYQGRRFPVNVSIIIDTLDRRYVFNCRNLSKADNGLKVHLSMPKSVAYLNRENNPITPIEFSESFALVSWEGMDMTFSGEVKNISNHSIWVDFNKGFFNKSFYSIISSSIINDEPMLLPMTVDIGGVQKTFIVSASEVINTGDVKSFVFDFIVPIKGGLDNIKEHFEESGMLIAQGLEHCYNKVNVSDSNSVTIDGRSDGSGSAFTDGEYLIGSVGGEYFMFKYLSKDGEGLFELEYPIGREIKISNDVTPDMLDFIELLRIKSDRYSKEKTSISVIN